MLSFDWWWAMLLLPLPLCARQWLTPVAPSDTALRVPILVRYRFSAVSTLPAGSRFAGIGLWIFWLALVLAASRPFWLGESLTRSVSGRDLMLAVDISGSMSESDMTIDDQAASRLEVLKLVVKNFIDRRQGDRLGLILFGTHAYNFVPLTFDLETLKELLLDVSTGLAGRHTAIGDAIGVAIKSMHAQRTQHKVLILMTDGSNTAGFGNPLLAAAVARRQGLTIHTIGVGSDSETLSGVYGRQNIPTGLVINEDLLRQIASLTGGQYFRATNRDTLARIYRSLDQLEPIEHEYQSHRPRRELFVWPLAMALGILMLVVGGRIWKSGRQVPA